MCPSDFWGMSFGEVYDVIQAYYDRRMADENLAAKSRAMLAYRLADLIGVAFNDPKKFPKLVDAFPELVDRKDAPEVPQWKREQAEMTSWVEAYNARIRKKGADK